MDLAWVSLAALLIVVAVSCTTAINPGVLSLVFAWVIGVYVAPLFGESIGMRGVAAGFPDDLFLTLVGVTLLFAQAQVNGTLERVTRAAVGLCRGNAGLVPPLFFLLAAALATIGAGSIAAALLAPLAMAAARRLHVPAFLMTVMVAHGAIGGSMSPFALTGIIARRVLEERSSLVDFEWTLYGQNLLANAAVAVGGYCLFGGLRLFRRQPPAGADESQPWRDGPPWFEGRHYLTLAVLAALIVSVVYLQAHVGMAAFAGAAALTLLRAADEGSAVAKMPWGVIVMVCGVSVLTALLERTGGMDRMEDLIASVSTPDTLPGVAALISGVVSVYSSTSGVVLPAFLPFAPRLADRVGGDAMSIVSATVIGSNLVDASPLSTIGALCIACAPADEDRKALFNKVLAWGLSMAVVAALGCWLLL